MFIAFAFIPYLIGAGLYFWCRFYVSAQGERITRATTTGRIIRSGRVVSTGRKGHSADFADIHFEYKVDGKRYINDRPFLVEEGNVTAQYLAKYPMGTEVKVHYNPGNPQESILTPVYSRVLRQVCHLALGAMVVGMAIAAVYRIVHLFF